MRGIVARVGDEVHATAAQVIHYPDELAGVIVEPALTEYLPGTMQTASVRQMGEICIMTRISMSTGGFRTLAKFGTTTPKTGGLFSDHVRRKKKRLDIFVQYLTEPHSLDCQVKRNGKPQGEGDA